MVSLPFSLPPRAASVPLNTRFSFPGLLAATIGVSLLPLTVVRAQTAPPAPTLQTASVSSNVRATKRPITHDVYDSWRSIVGAKLSRDGNWIAYSLAPQDGDGELIVRNRQTGREWRQPRGTGATFSADSKYTAFTISPTKAERDKAKKEKRPPADAPKSGFGILDLATGKAETVEKVKRWALADEGGAFVAYQLEPPAPARPTNRPTGGTSTPETPAAAPAGGTEYEADTNDFQQAGQRRRAGAAAPGGSAASATSAKGSDLVLRDLATGTTTTIADVADFVWDKNGTRLAYTVSGKDTAKNGAYVRDIAKGNDPAATAALLTGPGDYKTPVWDDKGTQIAFLAAPGAKPSETDKKPDTTSGTPAVTTTPPTETAVPATDKKDDTTVYTLYHAKTGDTKAEITAASATPGVPSGFGVSENAQPRFSKDGTRLYFGYAPLPKPKPKNAPDPVNVDVWSSSDPFIQPMQKLQADTEKKRSYVAVWHTGERKVVPLAAPDLPTVDTDSDVPSARYALGRSDIAYRQFVSWDQGYNDVYLVDQKTGERRKILDKQAGSASLSPGQKYLLYWNESDNSWYCLQTDGKKPAVNLTAKLGVSFADEDHDTPDAPPPHGVAGWTEGDKSVLLYDRYDIWEVKSDGSGARLATNGAGRAAQTELRYVRIDDEERFIPTDKPLLLSATDERTKAEGMYRLASLSPTARPEKLFLLDKAVGGFEKAKNADAVMFTLSRFEEFPNLWTTSLADLNKPNGFVRVSDANPQQANFVWGTSQLVDYKSADGKPLRAILTLPDNFDPAKKYPLMVYIYEKMTQDLHRYTSPSPGTSINFSRYVSNGYVLLRPDITYTAGYPGESALKCVLPAIQEVVDKGYIDEGRIGIQGHSWGAYQITYLVTRTNRFRAVEAGAAVSDMVSAYGGIRWSSGMSRAFQYEKTQSRIGAPPWIKPLQFLENSPIFWVDKVQTPYLTIHNDADGAVPWEQGIEFFSALRRLGKEAYLFNYNGEDHGLRSRDNTKHWTVHLAEFFDHYLLGAPRPDWMKNGVPYLERGTRDLTAFYTPKEGASSVSSEEAKTPGTAAAENPAAKPVEATNPPKGEKKN